MRNNARQSETLQALCWLALDMLLLLLLVVLVGLP
jgi:hypothetical protein